MLNRATEWFARLSTAAKLFLILTAAILPIGLGLVWIANDGVREANGVLREQVRQQSRLAVRGIESLIARNALALSVAANDRVSTPDACEAVRRSLAIAPAVQQEFAIARPDGSPVCATGGLDDLPRLPGLAPREVDLQIARDGSGLHYRVGIVGGVATGRLDLDELADAAIVPAGDIGAITVTDGERDLTIIDRQMDRAEGQALTTRIAIANGDLNGTVTAMVPVITRGERLILLLPVLMWVIAALMVWLLVTRLLIQPLRKLERSVSRFRPGEGGGFVVPGKLGPSTEIQSLRGAFARAVERVEESERQMADALDGQRRLVREVHHRVKNNLQVVASLLNIHGRSADGPSARAAYAGISRRVGALSVVHRNHFAEMEENRGIALRPLLSELAAELRAGAPEAARALRIELELENANTTQDVAVSIAFLITEIVEFAMLRRPEDPLEITLRRTSDLTAELTVASSVLNPEDSDEAEKVQFERIISGLAKQLRSDLDRRLGHYSVDLPVFPAEKRA